MEIDTIKSRIEAKLYGEEYSRGIMEFDFGDVKDPDLFNKSLKSAKEDCMKVDVKWVDADPMTSRIVIVSPKEHAQDVAEIMARYGFQLVNTIFDPKPTDMFKGKDTP
jgi:hypothetical protein